MAYWQHASVHVRYTPCIPRSELARHGVVDELFGFQLLEVPGPDIGIIYDQSANNDGEVDVHHFNVDHIDRVQTTIKNSLAIFDVEILECTVRIKTTVDSPNLFVRPCETEEFMQRTVFENVTERDGYLEVKFENGDEAVLYSRLVTVYTHSLDTIDDVYNRIHAEYARIRLEML